MEQGGKYFSIGIEPGNEPTCAPPRPAEPIDVTNTVAHFAVSLTLVALEMEAFDRFARRVTEGA